VKIESCESWGLLISQLITQATQLTTGTAETPGLEPATSH